MAAQERNPLDPNLIPPKEREGLLSGPEMIVPLTPDQRRDIDHQFEDKTSGLDLDKPFQREGEHLHVVPNADKAPTESNPEARKYAKMIIEGDLEGLKQSSNADPREITNALFDSMDENLEPEK